MSVLLVRAAFVFVLSIGFATLAGAQTIGTFKWQLQPYCNVLTLTVTQVGTSYRLDGFEDSCQPSRRSSAFGVAYQRSDGTIGLGVTIVTAPNAVPAHVDATINLATLSGTWRVNGFWKGTFAFDAATGGSPRPETDEGIFTWSTMGPGMMLGVGVNGTREAPLPPTTGRDLAVFAGAGYQTNTQLFAPAFMKVKTTENWTATALGAAIEFWTTANTTGESLPRMTVAQNGNVGIGNLNPVDRLQVAGDIRVGTPLVSGCIKTFAGSPIAGVCPSDARFKREVTPFGPALEAMASLRPVHFYWRGGEFPARGFGDAHEAGLIAQEVEQVLPSLVSTGADGFKSVDYSALPLLAVQAIKELKDQNDQLKAKDADLERRIAELETLLRNR